MTKISKLEKIKHVANVIDCEIDDVTNEMLWHTGEPQQELRNDLINLIYDLAIRQFTPEEIEYLKMRKRNGLTDVEG